MSPAGQRWSFVAGRELVADINGDGRDDLVNVQVKEGGGIAFWLRTSSGDTFSDQPTLLTGLDAGGWEFYLSRQYVADVDGDGRDDIVTMHAQPDGGSLLWWHRTNDAGTSSEAPVIIGSLSGGGWSYWSSRASVGHTRAV